METDSFLTIESPSEGSFKDKGSRFLAFAYPVRTEGDARIIIEHLRKEYHDARHHCYAWRLGTGQDHYRVNDDGEPSNSAGKPILGQIQAFQLTNVLVVVIRYFGGTLLGVGGLIHAYKTASMEALNHARIIKQFVYTSFIVRFRYEDMNLVMKVLKDMNLDHWDQKFEMECELKLKIKKSEMNKFNDSFRPDSSVKISFLIEE